VTLPHVATEATHVYHQYVVRTSTRDSLREFLRLNGVGTSIHYAVPVHQQPAYQGRLKIHQSLRETEQAAQEILSLPMFPQLPTEELDRVANQITTWPGDRP
jgi:dTDP-4-amino-4,6-dideoxygalactose transaminase